MASTTGERRSSQASLTVFSVTPRRSAAAGHPRPAAATQREVRHERDPFALAEVHDVVVPALVEVVAVLHGGDLHDPAGPLELLDAYLRDPDVADRATVDIRLDRAQALLQRRLRVDPVQVVQPDRVEAQRAQALLDLRPKHIRPPLARAVAPFGGDEHVLGGAVERLADRALTLPAGVQVRGVDVANARGHRLADERHMLGRGGQTIGAQADTGHVDAGESERVHAGQG
jgi:hypothetical protein